MKKLLSLVLATMLLLSAGAALAAEEHASLYYPEGKTITVMAIHWEPHPLKYEDSFLFPNIERLTGVKLDIDWRQETDYSTQVATMLAGGNLPDLIGPGNYGIMALASEGAIVPLDDYLELYGPNILAAVGEKNMASWRQPDGHIYTIPSITRIRGAQTTMIRKDWLDQLGLGLPATWDEWLTAWRGFRDNDMNGDGDPTNEIPLALEAGENGERSMAALLCAFGIKASEDTQFCVLDDGTYIPVYEHPRYGEFLEAVAGLYQEGILDPEFATRRQNDLFTIMDNGLCGSTFTWSERASVSTTANRNAGNADAFWQTIMPITGPAGDRNTQARDWRNGYYAVSSAAEKAGKVEDIITFFNWFYSDEGITLFNYGVEGETFDYVDGNPVLKPEITENRFTSMRSAGLQYEPFPGVWLAEQYMQCLTSGQAYDELPDMVQSFYDGLFTFNTDYFYAQPDTLETEAYTEFRAETITGGACVLRDQCIAGQITVAEFMAKYEALKPMGLTEIVEQGKIAYEVINAK